MAIQQRPKFYSDLLPGREFDTADDAETAKIEHKTRKRAQQYIEAYPPYPSPKFNAHMVDTIAHWELWNLGRLPGQKGQAEQAVEPPVGESEG